MNGKSKKAKGKGTNEDKLLFCKTGVSLPFAFYLFPFSL
jgi:hypothetical protein